MNVRELIGKLQQCPMDSPVLIHHTNDYVVGQPDSSQGILASDVEAVYGQAWAHMQGEPSKLAVILTSETQPETDFVASAGRKIYVDPCPCGGGYGFYQEEDENGESTGAELYCVCPLGKKLRNKDPNFATVRTP